MNWLDIGVLLTVSEDTMIQGLTEYEKAVVVFHTQVLMWKNIVLWTHLKEGSDYPVEQLWLVFDTGGI